MKRFTKLMLVLSLSSGWAMAHDEGTVTSGLAAHNALHKVENLVDRQKIDAAFNSALRSLSISSSTEAPGTYLAVVEQYPGADGKANKVEVKLDATAKALDYKVVAGSVATAVPTWPDKEPINLLEEALHQVVHAEEGTELYPFNQGFTTSKLSQATDGNAVVDIRSSKTKKVLRVTLGTDAKVISTKVIDEDLID